jgi:SNF2 family DNA or RNA helicase
MQNQEEYICCFKKDVVRKIPRNFVAEERFISKLDNDLLFCRESNIDSVEIVDEEDIGSWLITEHRSNCTLEDYIFDVLPELKQQGWQVKFADEFPINCVEEEAVEWYSELEESEYDWFDFKLGIKLDGNDINILPLLIDLLQKIDLKNINSLDANKKLAITLPDGRKLPIPLERIRNILNVLTELYDTKTLIKKDQLKLSKLRASQLREFQKAFQAAKFRWIGGERLLKLGEKLANFSSIKQVNSAKDFKAVLRPYQQQGLNWLQFLREYELSGILADDMGLGKTVQTLSLLLLEKEKQRAKKPSLIVMPTSLVGNWKAEAQKFAPKLKVLVLHGDTRHENFPEISKNDLVITTYPLLIRDKEQLLSNEYYYLILDEAHIIKNPNAKMTQIAHQLNAKHRLCLTGTPMENNLGELWSIMHFLMPGLLGDRQHFSRVFRTPIEKNNDNDRKNTLSQRVKPFVLRRLKQDVVKDLPPKTEIIRNVELNDVQRDLYESVRLAMHEKVTKAIKSKGLSRSHIIILDALLKLRQICCDPRLLKFEVAKKAHKKSAKLEMLMDMLPNLIEEGRRILLFSQFTSMIDLIEVELKNKNMEYVKLTGQTKKRAEVVAKFQNKEVPLFVISLKAGGTGLNLTAADTVIHYDPWWNPAVENQATDRTHRIGQDKAVFVYKFISAGTVEETILEMQRKKKSLMDGLFSAQDGSKIKLSPEDMQQLFKPL